MGYSDNWAEVIFSKERNQVLTTVAFSDSLFDSSEIKIKLNFPAHCLRAEETFPRSLIDSAECHEGQRACSGH